ncbi:MAG TPA: type II toxin-antitoxin system VapC family toxin [Candidatus Baltobacteraceae bacterium]|nr:type II toxin-antitoxin system VapC family toxin [Candidatus Baltobacteraceae bacterium]
MNLLLDTSVFIRLAADPKQLPSKVLRAVDAAERRIFSAASAWEIAIKSSIGKLELPLSADEWVRTRAANLAVDIEPVRFEHATAVEVLPMYHRDPFDRLLIGIANVEGYTLVTQDRNLAKYRVRLLAAWR